MNNFRLEFSRALAAAGALILAAAPSPAADINFDHYTSPSDNDLANHFLSDGSFQQVTGNGITGGAVQSAPPLGGSATYRESQSQPSVVSVSFLYAGQQTEALGPTARLGWVGDLAPVEFFEPSLYFWGEFFNDGRFGVRNNPTGVPGAANLVELGSIAMPSLGHWLRLNFLALPLGGGDFQFTVSLDDLGTSGMDSSARLFSGSTEAANNRAAADSSVYSGFYGYYRTSLYDNFSVQAVPEPASIFMIGTGAVLLGVGMRFRRRAT